MFGGGRDVWRGRVGGRDEDGTLHNLLGEGLVGDGLVSCKTTGVWNTDYLT
jgi:hypothetical protein